MDYDNDNIYILNEKQKYLYETIVEKQYDNIIVKYHKGYYDSTLGIRIDEIEFYKKILYSCDEKFNIFNFMLFENLDDEIKEKIYIIDTLLSMANNKCFKNIDIKHIKKICMQNNIKDIICKEFYIKVNTLPNQLCIKWDYNSTHKDKDFYEILFDEYKRYH